MEDKRMRSAFENMQPDEKSREKMWAQIEESAETSHGKVKRWTMVTARKMARTAATVILCLTVGAVSINAATGGKAWETVKEVLKMKNDDIVSDISEYPQTGAMDVYAPDICAMDDEHVIFATKRGLILVNRKTNTPEGVIDLQKIGCFYFNADTKKTNIFQKGNQIIIFNEEKNQPIGNYYVYDLEDANVKQWEPVTQGAEQKKLKAYDKAWKDYQKHYCDIEENPYLDADKLENRYKNGEEFSEHIFSWKNNAGAEYISYFMINMDYQYVLYTMDIKSKAEQEEVLEIKVSSEETSAENQQIIPAFRYTGDDAVLQAICPYIAAKAEKGFYHDKDSIWIPAFAIYAEVEKDGYLYVFGNFWSDIYQLNGNILESYAGGEDPARIKLKKTRDGYQVVEHISTGDGAMYLEGIKDFTEGFPGVYETFIEKQEQQWVDSGEKIEWNPKTRMKYIKMYVEQSHLDIKYYQDYGWDPVEIK